MGIFQSIEVHKEHKITTITFLGKEVDRDTFLLEPIKYLVDFLEQFPKQVNRPMIYMFKEIIKNIYDHGTGKATLTIIDHSDSVEFIFIDGNSTKVNFSQVSNLDNWSKKSGNNFGHGLRSIRGIAELNMIDFVIDDTKGGINYSGKIKKPTV